jgi:hypothetical protein
VFEADDFGEAFAPKLREKEQQLQNALEARQER